MTTTTTTTMTPARITKPTRTAPPTRPARERKAATPPPAPAARMIDDGLQHDAAALLQDRPCREWIAEQVEFLRQDLDSRSVSDVRRDAAGLWFLGECLSILNRVAGTEDTAE